MPKVAKTRKGAGWEDMMREAEERDRQNEADKASAAKIRDTAAADAKKRTGGTIRRRRCPTCHRKMPKSGGSIDGMWSPTGGARVGRTQGGLRTATAEKLLEKSHAAN